MIFDLLVRFALVFPKPPHKVYVLFEDRKGALVRRLMQDGVEFIVFDLRDVKVLLIFEKQSDVVYFPFRKHKFLFIFVFGHEQIDLSISTF
jgi:hypothetical protein